MTRQNIFRKNFPSAKCQHCGGITDIHFSHDWRQLIGKNQSQKEMIRMKDENLVKWMNIKNCQIQSMHKVIARLINLLDEDQKERAKKITQEMRDLIKMAEKNEK